MTEKKRTLKGKIISCIIMMVTTMMMFSTNVYATPNCTSRYSKNFTLTGNRAQDIVKVAKAQVKKTKSQLGYKQAWCAYFVLDCARLANIPATVIPYDQTSTGGCGNLYRYMINNCNAKVTSSPQAGDFVFYRCNRCDAYVHVGLYDGTGYMIEGNVNGQVMRYNTAYNDVNGHSSQAAKGQKTATIQKIYVRPNYQKSISSATITLNRTSFNYTGKSITPYVTVKYGSTTLKKGTDYTCSITNNVKPGLGIVTINGIGNYTGTKKAGFYILPKTPTGLKVKSQSKKLIVSYNKTTGATGYQIQYRKKGTSKWSMVTCSATSKTFSLARWTNYQVRVRAYVRVGIEYKYSGWSSIVTKRTGL